VKKIMTTPIKETAKKEKLYKTSIILKKKISSPCIKGGKSSFG